VSNDSSSKMDSGLERLSSNFESSRFESSRFESSSFESSNSSLLDSISSYFFSLFPIPFVCFFLFREIFSVDGGGGRSASTSFEKSCDLSSFFSFELFFFAPWFLCWWWRWRKIIWFINRRFTIAW